MHELDTVSVKGFKSIASIENLQLGAINVVIGPNGSGKSNFIGVFSFLHAIRNGRLQDYVIKAGGADKVLHFGAKVTKTLEIGISFQNERNQYSIHLEPTDADEIVPNLEVVYFWDKRHPRRYNEAIAQSARRLASARGKRHRLRVTCASTLTGGVCITFTIPAPRHR